MKFVLSILALILSLCFVSAEFAAPKAATPNGYIVSGLWDGKTYPSVSWAFDVGRLAVDWSPKDIITLNTFIAPRSGPANFPTWTAYDATSRSYFASVGNNISSSFLFAGTVTPSVGNLTSPTSLMFNYPQEGANQVALLTVNINNALALLSVYQNGLVDSIDTLTGARKHLRLVCNQTRQLTTAITTNAATGEIYMITENTRIKGGGHRGILTYNPQTGVITEQEIKKLQNHDEFNEEPFEMTWMPATGLLMVMYTGTFDQLVYMDPTTGSIGFATYNLAGFQGGGGDTVLGFTSNSELMMGDGWGNVAVDTWQNMIYFQCSSIDPNDNVVTTLCAIPILNPPQILSYVTVQQWPLSYGFAGMQWVQITDSEEIAERQAESEKRSQIA